MDEAFNALDPLIRRDMQQVLVEVQLCLCKTVVFMSHDLDEAILTNSAPHMSPASSSISAWRPSSRPAR